MYGRHGYDGYDPFAGTVGADTEAENIRTENGAGFGGAGSLPTSAKGRSQILAQQRELMRKKKADRLAAAGGMGMLFAASNAATGEAGGPDVDKAQGMLFDRINKMRQDSPQQPESKRDDHLGDDEDDEDDEGLYRDRQHCPAPKMFGSHGDIHHDDHTKVLLTKQKEEAQSQAWTQKIGLKPESKRGSSSPTTNLQRARGRPPPPSGAGMGAPPKGGRGSGSRVGSDRRNQIKITTAADRSIRGRSSAAAWRVQQQREEQAKAQAKGVGATRAAGQKKGGGGGGGGGSRSAVLHTRPEPVRAEAKATGRNVSQGEDGMKVREGRLALVARIRALELKERKAVESRDYALAGRTKEIIEQLRAQLRSGGGLTTTTAEAVEESDELQAPMAIMRTTKEDERVEYQGDDFTIENEEDEEDFVHENDSEDADSQPYAESKSSPSRRGKDSSSTSSRRAPSEGYGDDEEEEEEDEEEREAWGAPSSSHRSSSSRGREGGDRDGHGDGRGGGAKDDGYGDDEEDEGGGMVREEEAKGGDDDDLLQASPKRSLHGGEPENPIALDLSDRRRVLTSPLPVECGTIRGYVLRHFSGSTFTKLAPEGDEAFLLYAKKMLKNKSAHYRISAQEKVSSKQDPDYLGKLRAHSKSHGTEYTIYNDGESPKDAGSGQCKALRQELGVVLFDRRHKSGKQNGPRTIRAAVPSIGVGEVWQPESVMNTMLHQFKSHESSSACESIGLLGLRNKPPRYKKNVGYVLNFHGRVTMASIKNFQLIDQNDPTEETLLLFGRVDKNKFTCDFKHPLSPMQAFAIVLANFDFD